MALIFEDSPTRAREKWPFYGQRALIFQWGRSRSLLMLCILSRGIHSEFPLQVSTLHWSLKTKSGNKNTWESRLKFSCVCIALCNRGLRNFCRSHGTNRSLGFKVTRLSFPFSSFFIFNFRSSKNHSNNEMK